METRKREISQVGNDEAGMTVTDIFNVLDCDPDMRSQVTAENN